MKKYKDIFDSDDDDEEDENGHEGDDEEENEENEEKEKKEEKNIKDKKDKKEEKEEKENNEEDSKENKEEDSKENNNEENKTNAKTKNKNIIELDEDKIFDNTLYGIFIMGLPYETSETELKNIFSKYGEIIKIKLPKYQNTNKNVGHCYIYFNNEQSAIKSLELNRRKIGKRYMEITLSKPITNHYKEKKEIDPDDVPLDCKTAFVKNLNYNITEQEVDEKFKTCGQINAIRFVYDNMTNKFKGFCYIDFKEHKGLLKALKLNGNFFGGRKIKVDYEQGKPKKGKLDDDNEEFSMLNRKRYEY